MVMYHSHLQGGSEQDCRLLNGFVGNVSFILNHLCFMLSQDGWPLSLAHLGRKNAIETLQSKRQQSSLLLILEGNKTAIYSLALAKGKHLIFRYLHGIIRISRNKG